MKHLFLATTAAVALAAGVAGATVVGSVPGPGSSFNINFNFSNSGASDILSLSLDGTTGSAPADIVWDSIGSIGGTSDSPGVAGVDSTVVTFSWLVGGWTSGETFTLSGVDPDIVGNTSFGVNVDHLIGVGVTALFSDNSTFAGSFVDSQAHSGLDLVGQVSPVPIPAAGFLLVGALGGLAALRRRKKA